MRNLKKSKGGGKKKKTVQGGMSLYLSAYDYVGLLKILYKLGVSLFSFLLVFLLNSLFLLCMGFDNTGYL